MDIFSRPAVAYLVLDFEGTGKDTILDDITEVAVIGTDENYEPLFEYNALIDASASALERARQHPIVHQMMVASGLDVALDEAREAGTLVSLAEAERHLLAQIGFFNFSDQLVTLAGSGVATYDFPFIKQRMPDLAEKLNYFTADVGGLRREWRTATGTDLVPVNKDKTHRAADDVLCHLEEARAFRAAFKAIAARLGGADLASILGAGANV